MRALTVCQPYASLIMSGRKKIENRRWPTSYRGLLAIHAGKSRQWLGSEADLLIDDLDAIPFGALLGTVYLVDCVPYEACDGEPFAVGPWCWRLEHPWTSPQPIPYRGALGIFQIPDEIFRLDH